MKAIILAGKGDKELPKSSQFSTSLGWIINSMENANIKNINIVGGKEINNLKFKDRQTKILFNSNWEKTGPLESLLLCEDLLLESDIIVSFGDVVYDSVFIKNFVDNIDKSKINILTDNTWKSRYYRDSSSLAKAEKITVNQEGFVKSSSRSLTNLSDVAGEYTGVCYLNKGSSRNLISTAKKLVNSFSRDTKYPPGFMDLFSEMINQGFKIKNHFSDGNWAELDNLKDFYGFTFGNKSQTLKNLKGSLQNAKVLPQYSFTVGDWEHSKQKILSKIKNFFERPNLIIRSSSLSEDSLTSSMAGQFESVLNIDRDDGILVSEAIEKVIESFGSSKSPSDIIFVQPILPNVKMSGVAFTCDISTGSPYICINFTESTHTDLVTSGSKAEYKLFFYIKNSSSKIKNKYMRKLVSSIDEIENLMNNQMLDIEFAFNKKGELYIFQVRPIASEEALANYDTYNLLPHINKERKNLDKIFVEKKDLGGKTTILGNMPDWNPAELIGSRPKPLSRTLFHTLITKKVWREAREKIGYFNPSDEELLRIVLGQPYIDVRNSLNSFSPSSLPNRIRDKLVDESLNFLKSNPELHDKLEFDVATTCYTSFFEDRITRWNTFGISPDEIETMRLHFREHTNIILKEGMNKINNLLKQVENFDVKRQNLMLDSTFSELEKVKILIEGCRKNGTLPFSILARFAFIGNTFLKSFVDEGIISKQSYDSFLNSIETVATDLLVDLEKLRKGNLNKEEFLSTFGHLRPGTFDIESLRYDENLELYFSMDSDAINKNSISHKFSFSELEKKGIEKELKKLNLDVDYETLINFIKSSIKGREFSKFIFTKSVSDSLSLIKNWGFKNNFTPNDLSYIDYNLLIGLNDKSSSEQDLSIYSLLIDNEKNKFHQYQAFHLPDLITESRDIIEFFIHSSRPNFITTKKILSTVVNIDSNFDNQLLKNKIIFIESADPGYDWIFSHKIGGLVTKYGGAASHMAIRCAEFGIPAAIGSGQLFDKYKTGDRIIMDCLNKLIESA